MIKSMFGDEMIYVNKQDAYGGIDININMTEPHRTNLRWLSQFRYEYEEEKRLRETNQAVQKAYEHYEMIKMLAQKEKETV
jgi:hypothetical protein